MARDTAKFFQLMNSMNNDIAARVTDEIKNSGGGDPIRVERDIERRDKAGGTLSAKPRKRNRPIQVIQWFT